MFESAPLTTLELDETAFVRLRALPGAAVVDLAGRRRALLDVVQGRDAFPARAWLASRPQQWRDGIEWE